MDFVVVGFGLGGLALLVGLVLRDRAARRTVSAETAVPISGSMARGGALLAAAGALLLVVTAGALAVGSDDRTGAFAVAAVLTVKLLAGFAWAVRALPRRRNRGQAAALASAPTGDGVHPPPVIAADGRSPAAPDAAAVDRDAGTEPPAAPEPDAPTAPPWDATPDAEPTADRASVADDPTAPTATPDDRSEGAGDAPPDAAPQPAAAGDEPPDHD